MTAARPPVFEPDSPGGVRRAARRFGVMPGGLDKSYEVVDYDGTPVTCPVGSFSRAAGERDRLNEAAAAGSQALAIALDTLDTSLAIEEGFRPTASGPLLRPGHLT